MVTSVLFAENDQGLINFVDVSLAQKAICAASESNLGMSMSCLGL